MSSAIGVVIPTLNEAASLPATLAALAGEGVAMGRVVVADCQSRDGTASAARAAGAVVVESDPARGRGGALRRGVAALPAEVGVVWMLHADTPPPPGGPRLIAEALADPAVAGGAFRPLLDTRGATYLQRKSLRTITFINRRRCRLTGIHFGDQAIFARRSALEAVGGVPDLPVLEDIELCRRLPAAGRVVLLDAAVTTSSRRFLRHGVVRQALHDWAILATLRLGTSPARLVRRYNEDNAGGRA